MEKPPSKCKYQHICKWYEEKNLWSEGCYEFSCWRATALDNYIDLSKLEKKISPVKE